MKFVWIVLGVLVVVCIIIILVMVSFGPSAAQLKQYDPMKNPAIRSLPDQKMIIVEMKGKPSETAGKAIGKLYQVFFQLKNNSIRQAAPRARWPITMDMPETEWTGVFALPVSEEVTALPEQKGDIAVKLGKWQYGEVAEILHIGPYASEMATIDKLVSFISQAGYKIIGDHEEEYLKGPSPLFDDPKGYYTVIRYRVAKK